MRGKKRDEVLIATCARCGRNFIFKEHYARGEEPVYDAERHVWFCSWSCYEKGARRR